MKIQGFHQIGLALATAFIVAFSGSIFAQDMATPPVTVATQTTAPGLTQPVAQVLQLSQAKVSDSTIVAFVQNSGTVYGLNADQIVYLKQQGVSETVIDAMLNQRSAMVAAAAQTPPPQTTMPVQAPVPDTTVAQPATPAPSSVYVVPDTQTYNYDSSVYAYPNYYPYYYPYYAYYGWPGSFSFYWGGRGGYWGGWHGGGGWGGGWHGSGGGFHGGGGFHSGGGFHH